MTRSQNSTSSASADADVLEVLVVEADALGPTVSGAVRQAASAFLRTRPELATPRVLAVLEGPRVR